MGDGPVHDFIQNRKKRKVKRIKRTTKNYNMITSSDENTFYVNVTPPFSLHRRRVPKTNEGASDDQKRQHCLSGVSKERIDGTIQAEIMAAAVLNM